MIIESGLSDYLFDAFKAEASDLHITAGRSPMFTSYDVRTGRRQATIERCHTLVRISHSVNCDTGDQPRRDRVRAKRGCLAVSRRGELGGVHLLARLPDHPAAAGIPHRELSEAHRPGGRHITVGGGQDRGIEPSA